MNALWDFLVTHRFAVAAGILFAFGVLPFLLAAMVHETRPQRSGR